MNSKTIINCLIIFSLILPVFVSAQGLNLNSLPDIGEIKNFGQKILGVSKEKMPASLFTDSWNNQILPFWNNEAFPLWQKVYKTGGELVQKIYQWFREKSSISIREELKKRKQLLQEEFPKELKEMKEDIPNVWKIIREKIKSIRK